MNVGVTVWGNRISPVFDSAQTLLVVEIDGDRVVNRHIEMFQPGSYRHFIDILAECAVEVLICGALSRGSAVLLEATGVTLIPFMTGEVETILPLYARGSDLADFTMPGCRRNRCCRANQCTGSQQRIRYCWL